MEVAGADPRPTRLPGVPPTWPRCRVGQPVQPLRCVGWGFEAARLGHPPTTLLGGAPQWGKDRGKPAPVLEVASFPRSAPGFGRGVVPLTLPGSLCYTAGLAAPPNLCIREHRVGIFGIPAT